MHLSTVFRSKGHKLGECPVAEAFFDKSVSLPIHPRLTDEAIDYLIQSVHSLAKSPKINRSSSLVDSLLTLSASPRPRPTSSLDRAWDDFCTNVKQAQLFDPEVPILACRAPGRLDLMGGNDDYTGGLVFQATISEGTWAASQKRTDGSIVFCNPQMAAKNWKTSIVIDLNILNDVETVKHWLSSNPDCRWMAYTLGVLFWFKDRFPKEFCSGVSVFVAGDVPLNKGVSSSASVEVATLKSVSATFGVSLAGTKLATACQWAENIIADSACGIMDQMAVTFGGEGLIMPMICQPSIVQPLVSLPPELQIYAIDSGVSHQVSGIEYEAARAACFMGYKMMCDRKKIECKFDDESEIPRFSDPIWKGYLANVSPSSFRYEFEPHLPNEMLGKDYLNAHGEHVDPCTKVLPQHTYRIRANTRYAVEENHRVQQFVSLLRSAQDQETFRLVGELMYLSHIAYTECGLGCQQTDTIVDLVRNVGVEGGLFGAKITGGGAGGTVAVLGLKSARNVFYQQVVEKYATLTGQAPKVFEGSSIGADLFGVRSIDQRNK